MAHEMVRLEEAVEAANAAGIAPGDIAQRVLELCHRMDKMPCGEGEAGGKARVTTIIEPTGEIEQKVMGPDADYVLTVGPKFHLEHEQIYPGTGTTQLTIKRRA